VTGNVVLDRNTTATGTLRMVNARIGGSLRLTAASVDVTNHDDGPHLALRFDGSEIRGDLDLRRAQITGESRLVDVWVRGSMFADYAKLHNPGADALQARRFSVGGNMDARDMHVEGSLLMPGTKIGVNLDLRATRMVQPGTRRRNGHKASLDLQAADIGRDLICAAGRNPFAAHGGVRMHRAVIGRETDFSGAVLGSAMEGSALDAFGITTQELILSVGQAPRGEVILRHAHCTTLADNPRFWDATKKIDLEDFRYDALAEPIDLKNDAEVLKRLTQLRHAMRAVYRPGPYDQLATMLRASGNEEHASTVLMHKQRWRYRALADGYHIAGPAVQLWSWLQRSMVGYGYRPIRALGWLLLLLAFGTFWFGLHTEACDFHAGTLIAGHCSVSVDETGLVWNPFLYTLDLLVPIIDFGNKGRWHMVGIDQWMSSAFIAAGWILATTVAAGLTNSIRRQ
ncbi:MAG: oxidoreductase, partial [Sciscionella sp.]